MNAASSGPSDEPKLPPVWNSDCAKPCRPPEATRAIRDDSGWKIDDATPISAAPASSNANRCAKASTRMPESITVMPTASEYGRGVRSVCMPTSGCSTDAVPELVSVISPICQ